MWKSKRGFSYADENGGDVRVQGRHYDPVRQIRHETAHRRWPTRGWGAKKRARLALRLIFPRGDAGDLHYNGFTVLHRYGDWDASPLTGESRVIIHVCRTLGTTHPE